MQGSIVNDSIKNIEEKEGVKFAWPDYTRLNLKSGRRLDLLKPDEVKQYKIGDKVEYKIDDKGKPIYKEPGVVAHLRNKTLEKRMDNS